MLIAVTDYFMYFTITIDSYTPMNKFYSFIIFLLLINAVILLFRCIFDTSSLYTFSPS